VYLELIITFVILHLTVCLGNLLLGCLKYVSGRNSRVSFEETSGKTSFKLNVMQIVLNQFVFKAFKLAWLIYIRYMNYLA